MPLLTYTAGSYPFVPFTKILSGDMNTMFTDIQTLLNTTKLDDTNLQNAGITRATKLKLGTANALVKNNGSGAMSELTVPTAGLFVGSNGTDFVAVTNPLSSQFNVILGSAAQVTAGAATHSTFASYTPIAGDRILILPAYATTEAVSLNVANLYVQGLGGGCVITGTFTLGASATSCLCQDFKITDNATITGNSNMMKGIIFAATKTFVDNSTGSYLEGIQL